MSHYQFLLSGVRRSGFSDDLGLSDSDKGYERRGVYVLGRSVFHGTVYFLQRKLGLSTESVPWLYHLGLENVCSLVSLFYYRFFSASCILIPFHYRFVLLISFFAGVCF